MYKHKRGVIKESAVKAILHDPLFSQKVVKPKKGKGSYRRGKPSAYLSTLASGIGTSLPSQRVFLPTLLVRPSGQVVVNLLRRCSSA